MRSAWMLTLFFAAAAFAVPAAGASLACFPVRGDVTVQPLPPVGGFGLRGATEEVHGVWTGTQLLVWHSANNFPQPRASEEFLAYDPGANAWKTFPLRPPSELRAPTLVYAAGRAILWGGVNTSASRITNEGVIFDPATGTSRPTSRLNAPLARHYHLAIAVGGKMLVFGGGGYGPRNGWSCDGALLDPIANVWSPIAPPPESLCPSVPNLRLAASDGRRVGMLVPDPPPGQGFRAAFYDVTTRRWTLGPKFELARPLTFQYAPAFGPDGALYAVGAESAWAHGATLLRIDPESGAAAELASVPEPGTLFRSGDLLRIVGAGTVTEVDVRSGRCTFPTRAMGFLGQSATQVLVGTDDGFIAFGHGDGSQVRFGGAPSVESSRKNVQGAAVLGPRGWCGGATPPPWTSTPGATAARDVSLFIRRGDRNVDPHIVAKLKTDADGLFEARLGKGRYCVVDQSHRNVRLRFPKGTPAQTRQCLRDENARCLATFEVPAAGAQVPVIVRIEQPCRSPCALGPPPP